jgi:hypothetical protein
MTCGARHADGRKFKFLRQHDVPICLKNSFRHGARIRHLIDRR